MSDLNQPIRVGVVGVGRGQSFMQGANDLLNMKLVAICDIWEEKLAEVGQKFCVATYTDYDTFLQHDMDAIILANYFDEHTPFAIKALERGLHVMSETSCNVTLAEGVALCRAVEKSKKTYMLAENYPFTVFNQEMRRLYRSGEIGEAVYADGEYCHAMDMVNSTRISPGLKHWRNHLPPTYYCTHALAPLMYITDLEPVSVNALSMPFPQYVNPVRQQDKASVILCQMTNGAVFKLMFGVPGHSNWYRLHGSDGAMEITRGPGYFGPGEIRIWHDEWKLKDGQVTDMTYKPEWPEHGELAKKSGHGGGDFWTNHYFAEAIRSGQPPYLDVYRGVAMSSVGILAWKSAHEGGKAFKMPDFRDESARRAYEQDNWCPFPRFAGPGQPYPSISGPKKISEEAVAKARAIWAADGYQGDS